MNLCKAFTMESPSEAVVHIKNNCDRVADYGDMAYGHILHTWDDGNRTLRYCRECKAYIFTQNSEYHGPEDGYYTDIYAVESPEEAEELNKKYNGWDLETDYKSKYPQLSYTSGHGWYWRNK